MGDLVAPSDPKCGISPEGTPQRYPFSPFSFQQTPHLTASATVASQTEKMYLKSWMKTELAQ